MQIRGAVPAVAGGAADASTRSPCAGRGSSGREWCASLGLAALGLLALLLGVLVYAVDRRAGHSLLIPMAGALAGGPGFGALALWLPSFLHPLAFGLFTAALLPARSAWRPLACVLWGMVNAAFEFGQHPQVSVALAPMMLGDTGAEAAPWRQALAAYFMAGTFDPADLMATALGTALALVALQAASNHRERFDAS